MPLEAQPLPAPPVPGLYDLLRQRDALATQVDRQKTRLHGLQAELRQLESDILRAGGLASRDIPINALFTDRLGSEAGELARLIAEAFEASSRGLSSRDIAASLMNALALDASDRKAVRYVMSRVCVQLWVLEQKGLVRRLEPRQSPQLWQWVTP